MTRIPLRFSAIVLGLLLASQAVAADDYRALLWAKKYDEVEKAANAKLAQEPSHAGAMVARTSAIIGADEARIDEAVAQAEKCVATHPNDGACHVALGKALGSKAIIKGIMASLGSAGTIRDAFKKAVQLNPADFDARFSLLEYYMLAPFVVGGGKGKAETFAKENASIHLEAGKLMFGMLDANEGNLSKAEATALAAKPGAEEELRERHEALFSSIGGRYIAEKKYADADRVFREAQKRYPDSSTLSYLAARLLQEQGKHREASSALEQVAAKLPRANVHYRIGQSFQALGDKAKAVAAYEKALGAKSGLPKTQRADAEVQLKALRG